MKTTSSTKLRGRAAANSAGGVQGLLRVAYRIVPGMRKTQYALLLSLAVIIGFSFSARAQYTPPHEEPGPAVERLYFKAFNVDRAPLDLEAGEMDLYYFNLKIAAARELRDKEGIQLYEAPASTISLILNPAPAPEGRLNPFAIKEVRQAMQRLIDREFVTREIYQGQASPMYTNVASTDFDYLTVFDVIQQADLSYDPEYARQQIAEAMTEAGAFEAIVETMGHEKLMYGTDFHVSHIRGRCVAVGDSFHWLYADEMDLDEKHIALQPVLVGLESLRSIRLACQRLKLSERQIEDIFYGNAASLLEIE